MLYNISIGVKHFCFTNKYVLHTPLSHTDEDTHRQFFWKSNHNKYIGIDTFTH